MSKMVENVIKELERHKKDITTLIVIADTERVQINKIGMHGATTDQVMQLIATLEMMKLSLIDTLQNGEGFVEDGEPVPEEYQEDNDGDDDKGKKFH